MKETVKGILIYNREVSSFQGCPWGGLPLYTEVQHYAVVHRVYSRKYVRLRLAGF